MNPAPQRDILRAMDASDRLPRHLLIGFGLALLLYITLFAGDQYVRARHGPWEVEFTTNQAGWAAIRISQAKLDLHSTVIFSGERATNQGTVLFDRPGKAVPFGTVKFEDLTYLPGSVAFDFFGHEVELLPRTLYLNKREQRWTPGAIHTLEETEKLPPNMWTDPRKRKRK